MGQNFFAFSFGGSNDYGKMSGEGDTFVINFPRDDEVGYGFAIRNGIDCDIPNNGVYNFSVHSDHKINVIVEIKTERSGGAPEITKTFGIIPGENVISAEISESLSSGIKEVVLFIPRADNPELQTFFKLESYNFN